MRLAKLVLRISYSNCSVCWCNSVNREGSIKCHCTSRVTKELSVSFFRHVSGDKAEFLNFN